MWTTTVMPCPAPLKTVTVMSFVAALYQNFVARRRSSVHSTGTIALTNRNEERYIDLGDVRLGIVAATQFPFDPGRFRGHHAAYTYRFIPRLRARCLDGLLKCSAILSRAQV